MDIRRAWSFWEHQLRAQSAYAVHSPFVYQFYQQVLKHRRSGAGAEVEALRQRLTRRQDRWQPVDLGAGSKKSLTTLGEAVRRAGRRRFEGEFLYRLCHWLQPENPVELGTHTGISGLYQAAGLSDGQLITVEGDPVLARLAQANFAEFGLKAEVICSSFKDFIRERVVVGGLRPDYLFLDGHHQGRAVLDYFEDLLPYFKSGGLMILDDINWSKDMKQAWKTICEHPEVTVSIDLFVFGLVFIRRSQAKQHFKFRFPVL